MSKMFHNAQKKSNKPSIIFGGLQNETLDLCITEILFSKVLMKSMKSQITI